LSNWSLLDDELARWREAGRSAEIWWRDDDACEETAALDRLLALQEQFHVPLALAVVPAHATPGLAQRLAASAGVDILQHGYGHVNHALPGDKKCELGPERPAMVVLGELGTGWLALERLFGGSPFAGRLLPVMVPPWNRIAPGLVPALAEIGLKGLSTFGPRQRPEAVRGLLQINTHLDLIDWQGAHCFVGENFAIERLVSALAQSRTSAHTGRAEPVGVLSHHLAMDEGAWDFLNSLWERLSTTATGLRMPAAHELFASREARV
jgi:hypothetical protein